MSPPFNPPIILDIWLMSTFSNILDRSGDEPSAEFPSKLLKSGNPPPAGDEPEAEEEEGELPPNIEVKSGMFINPPLPVLGVLILDGGGLIFGSGPVYNDGL
jgi:hypothetical protein